MRRSIGVLVLGSTLLLPVMAQAQPSWQQNLQGLMGGNQQQNDQMRQAYQRGYEHGRDDEARALQQRSGNNYDQNRYQGSNEYSNRGDQDNR